MENSKQLHTLTELANALKVPKSWVYSRTRIKGTDSIPCIRCGRHLRFELDEVLAWFRRERKEE